MRCATGAGPGAASLAARMTDVPPPRYRVVERNRRLDVIDTRAGQARTSDASAPRRERRPAIAKVSFDGTADLMTQRFYDDKAPRSIRLDPGRAATVGRIKVGALVLALAFVVAVVTMPWLLAIPFALFSEQVRKPIRRRVTAWLDQAERESA